MKLARWTERAHDTSIRHGFVIDQHVIEFPKGQTVHDMLRLGLAETQKLYEDCLAKAVPQDFTPLSSVQLVAPVDPPSIRDFVTFEEHVEGMTASANGAPNVPAEWYELPTFYFTNPHTVRSTGEVIHPPHTQRLDFELELAAIIGAPDSGGAFNGQNLSPGEASDYIFGYTIMNDWSARDIQSREMAVKLGPCKGKDFAMTLGPWIVTADEVASKLDPEGFLQLTARVWVNDELIGQDMVSNMGWPFNELVAYASRNSQIVPGDVLGSGTVGNGGCLAELWGRGRHMSPGPLRETDTVKMEIESIGVIHNVIGAAVQVPDIPPARTRTRSRPA